MYQAWPWGGTASASPTSGFVQPNASSQVAGATTQWPAGYSQYTVTPELQQQWAAAWASQAQYAYSGNVPVAEAQTATSFAGAYPDFQTATPATTEVKKPDDSNTNSEKPKTAAEQPVSQTTPESDKLKQLKEQAEQWINLQQPTAASWSYSTTATTTGAVTTTPNTNGPTVAVTTPIDSSSLLSNTIVTQSSSTQGQMTKEEEEFERQFKNWEEQFDAWKQQNMNHPDKEAFAQYEKQWQEWRAQLLQKKEQMQKTKAEQLAQTGVQATTTSGNVTGLNQAISTSITDTTATTTPGMFYQPPQYMYMQPYMYPGATAVTPAGVPPTIVPPPIVPPGAVMPPVAVPPVTMPPPTALPQQLPFTIPTTAPPPPPENFSQPPPLTGPAPGHGHGPGPRPSGDFMQNENMNYNQRRPDFDNERDMYNYGPGGRNVPRDENAPYENFDNANMPEGDFQRDNWSFQRGRGRGGRGRARGRGGPPERWPEPNMDMRPGGPGAGRTPRKTLLPDGPPPFKEEEGPPPFEYPTEDCRDEFAEDRHFTDDRPGPHSNHPPGPGDRFRYRDGPDQYPQDDSFGGPKPFDERYPPDSQEFPDIPPDHKRFPPDHKRFPREERFPGGPNDEFPPDRKRFPPGPDGGFPPEHERFPGPDGGFPPGRDGGFPPDHERFPPGPDGGFPPEHERFPPGPDDGFPHDNERFPPGPEGFPPDGKRFPPGPEEFPPDGERFPPGPDAFPPEREQFPPGPEGFGPDQERFPPDQERFPPKGGRFGPDKRFPQDDDRFENERFPPGPEGRFPPRGMMEDGSFNRDFDQFPPEGPDMFGPSQFRDEFSPFEERGARGRGRFAGRGGRRFGGDFDRFGPQFNPRMRNDFGPPEFPQDERFGFPGEGSSRMPPPRGMRPPFGPPGRGRFQEDRFFDEGPQRCIDYTHRPAAAVMGEDFNPHYEFEADFQNDVNDFRAQPQKRKRGKGNAPKVTKKSKSSDEKKDE